MKYPVKFLLLTVVVFVFSFSELSAQRGGSPEKHAERRTERLAEDLNLSPEQVEQVNALHLAQESNRETERKNRVQREETERAAFAEEMRAILTDEQFAKFENIKPPKRGRGKGRKGKRGDRKGGDQRAF